MNVTLTPALERFVELRVKAGRYDSASEVVREALRLLQDQERVRERQLAALQRRVDEGLASLDRGEGVDGEEFMARLIKGLDTNPSRRKVK